ncbi:Ribosomal protein S6 kinase delta-1 [Papilio machaon]|uniref:Ribosomal protein S6 kinase delta-1 n=1 Tax=Papilio machaon TaxID=76193 RepID=A0A0N0PEI9_PAPMA|nr:Ribosomal protein S6 kinase delta-1 [Papilio machaon]
MSTKDKWVRRFTVDETAKHKNGFTIYKITSVLFPLESPEAVTVVSVWKRYSDIQALHGSMKTLHSGLHLRGTFPVLPKNNYFKRFQSEVIEERAKSIKILLEFIAEHRLLFTSTVFVNFLQTGYPEPVPQGGVINAIRSSLHLPIEETPPLEYQTSDDDSRSPNSARTPQENIESANSLDISQIPIYEAADVELRQSPKNTRTDSFESINSIESINSDFYDELNKIKIDKTKPCVKTKNVLPDLINFDAPSTSNALKFDDYHTMGTEIVSVTSDSPVRVKEMENSYVYESPLYDTNNDDVSVTSRAMDTEIDGVASLSSEVREKDTEIYDVSSLSSEVRLKETDKYDVSSLSSEVRVKETEIYEDVSSLSSQVRVKETEIYEGVSSLSSEVRVKETEDSYVFEAGYLLSLGARSEDSGQYRRAFHCYRAGIEKMLIGVRSDCDTQRRAIIKEKINKYLNYAETIYNNHLIHNEDNALPDSAICCWAAQLLVAIEALHNCGVVCVDLNPRNILLGERGQIILTYFIHYPGVEMSVCKTRDVNMYVAPELYSDVFLDTDTDREGREGVCDFWSYGAVLYELICGVPLSYYHRSVFTSHTLLQLPDTLPLEARSLLTQVTSTSHLHLHLHTSTSTHHSPQLNTSLYYSEYHIPVLHLYTSTSTSVHLRIQLLTSEPSQRLGGGRAGLQEIKQHPYFRGVDWPRVRSAWTVPR